jgi:glutaconate CoA-transferase subunit A
MKIRPDLKTMVDPYSGNEYVVIPAIIPDVAIIYATKGDRFGGVTTLSMRDDRLLARASKKTIAVVEELLEPDEVLPARNEVYIAPVHIDAVVHAPRGAHPTGYPGKYDVDGAHIKAYMTASKDDSSFRQYLDAYVYGPKDHNDYLKKVGLGAYGK